MRKWTDTKGNTHTLPRIDYSLCCRLRDWGVCDLLSLINSPDEWESFFDRVASDGEFIINLAYAIEHSKAGSDEQQQAFGNLLVGGESGSDALLNCSDALRDAVIDFFPGSLRDAIRQFLTLTQTQKAMATMKSVCPELDSVLSSDSVMPGNGSNGCSESSSTTEPGLVSGRSVSVSME